MSASEPLPPPPAQGHRAVRRTEIRTLGCGCRATRNRERGREDADAATGTGVRAITYGLTECRTCTSQS